jgi:hypothetical protein
MPPNTLPEITYKRSVKRESYWQKTKFASPAYYEEEFGKLIGKQIPVHAYYLKTEAEQAFKKIVDRSGG